LANEADGAESEAAAERSGMTRMIKVGEVYAILSRMILASRCSLSGMEQAEKSRNQDGNLVSKWRKWRGTRGSRILFCAHFCQHKEHKNGKEQGVAGRPVTGGLVGAAGQAVHAAQACPTFCRVCTVARAPMARPAQLAHATIQEAASNAKPNMPPPDGDQLSSDMDHPTFDTTTHLRQPPFRPRGRHQHSQNR
jgi:hypothetical protein